MSEQKGEQINTPQGSRAVQKWLPVTEEGTRQGNKDMGVLCSEHPPTALHLFSALSPPSGQAETTALVLVRWVDF